MEHSSSPDRIHDNIIINNAGDLKTFHFLSLGFLQEDMSFLWPMLRGFWSQHALPAPLFGSLDIAAGSAIYFSHAKRRIQGPEIPFLKSLEA
jgi:hypothetical protein